MAIEITEQMKPPDIQVLRDGPLRCKIAICRTQQFLCKKATGSPLEFKRERIQKMQEETGKETNETKHKPLTCQPLLAHVPSLLLAETRRADSLPS